jgi:hypothetical protein
VPTNGKRDENTEIAPSNVVNLPRGVTAKIELLAMPEPDATGNAPPNLPNTYIRVSRFRDDANRTTRLHRFNQR